jgi:hypothetical protein
MLLFLMVIACNPTTPASKTVSTQVSRPASTPAPPSKYKACTVDTDCHPSACGPCTPNEPIPALQPSCTVNPCLHASARCSEERICVVGPGTEKNPAVWK